VVKSVILNTFEVIAVLIVSLMAWIIVIGTYQSGYDSPSMFNNYSAFKEYAWSAAEKAYIQRYALYSEDSGADYFYRTNSIWTSAASANGATIYQDARTTCSISGTTKTYTLGNTGTRLADSGDTGMLIS
jgi:hypothetical protein